MSRHHFSAFPSGLSYQECHSCISVRPFHLSPHVPRRCGSLLAALAAPQHSDDAGEVASQFAASMGVSTQAVHALMDDCPGILHQPPRRLQQLLWGLQQAMGVPMDKILVMIRRKPEVLSCSPHALIGRCQHLSYLLGVPVDEMRDLVVKQPEFLDMSAERLTLRFQRLRGALEASVPDTLKALARLPASPFHELLSMRTMAIHERLTDLEILIDVEGLALHQGPRASLASLPSRQQEEGELGIDDRGHLVFGPSSERQRGSGNKAAGRVKEWDLATPPVLCLAGEQECAGGLEASGMQGENGMSMQALRQRMLQKISLRIQQVMPPQQQGVSRRRTHSAGEAASNSGQAGYTRQHGRREVWIDAGFDGQSSPGMHEYGQKASASYPGLERRHRASSSAPAHSSPSRSSLSHSNHQAVSHGEAGRELCNAQVTPPSYVTCIVLKCPRLLVETSIDDLAAAYNVVHELLKVPQTSMLALFARCPDLLLLPARQISSTVGMLGRTLGLPHDKLVTRVLQQPAILRLSRDKIQEHCEGLTDLLSPLAQSSEDVSYLAIRILRNQPQILLLSLNSLNQKVEALGKLLCLSQNEIKSRMVALQAVAKQPSLLTLSVNTVNLKFSFLSSFFRASADEVSAMIQAEPSVLTLSCKTVEHKLHGLCGLMGLPLNEIRLLALKHPILLAVPTANLEYKVAEMSLVLGLSTRDVVALLIIYPPAVLRIPPSKFKKMLNLHMGSQIETGSLISRGDGPAGQVGQVVEMLLRLPAKQVEEKLRVMSSQA